MKSEINLYEGCGDFRYTLGCLKTKNLYFIALNPSTADDKKGDQTSKFIEGVAKDHNYDGWCIFNLCPIRSTDPKLLPVRIEDDIIIKNLLTINNTIPELSDVCLMYGDYDIQKTYLSDSCVEIKRILQKKQCNLYYCGGISKTRHNPYHPSYIKRAKLERKLYKLEL